MLFRSDRVGVSVERGVVRVVGQVDCTHAVLTVRRIAAGPPNTAAIIDDLWVGCE